MRPFELEKRVDDFHARYDERMRDIHARLPKDFVSFPPNPISAGHEVFDFLLGMQVGKAGSIVLEPDFMGWLRKGLVPAIRERATHWKPQYSAVADDLSVLLDEWAKEGYLSKLVTDVAERGLLRRTGKTPEDKQATEELHARSRNFSRLIGNRPNRGGDSSSDHHRHHGSRRGHR